PPAAGFVNRSHPLASYRRQRASGLERLGKPDPPSGEYRANNRCLVTLTTLKVYFVCRHGTGNQRSRECAAREAPDVFRTTLLVGFEAALSCRRARGPLRLSRLQTALFSTSLRWALGFSNGD